MSRKPALLLRTRIDCNCFNRLFVHSTDTPSFITSYIVLPVFFLMVVGWKLVKKTTFVRLDDMDFDSGKRQRECLRSPF